MARKTAYYTPAMFLAVLLGCDLSTPPVPPTEHKHVESAKSQAKTNSAPIANQDIPYKTLAFDGPIMNGEKTIHTVFVIDPKHSNENDLRKLGQQIAKNISADEILGSQIYDNMDSARLYPIRNDLMYLEEPSKKSSKRKKQELLHDSHLIGVITIMPKNNVRNIIFTPKGIATETTPSIDIQF